MLTKNSAFMLNLVVGSLTPKQTLPSRCNPYATVTEIQLSKDRQTLIHKL